MEAIEWNTLSGFQELKCYMKKKLQSIQLYHNDGECYKNKYEPLDLSCVESHLKKYVKEKDLQAYNAALPSEEEINDYIEPKVHDIEFEIV